MSQLCSGIETASMPWCHDAASPARTGSALRSFFYWAFAEFVNPLLAVCFYVTEGEGLGSQLLYYRKPVWTSLMQRGEQQLKESFVLVG